MIKAIDNWLNRTTMYRLLLYYVLSLWLAALVLSFFGLLPYLPLALIFSAACIAVVGFGVNAVLARILRVPSNPESVYATIFILALIMPPLRSANDLWFLGGAAALAMASKYILAINKKHIFNPAAFGAATAGFVFQQYADWWVGNAYLLPFILAGGLLVVRKIRRFDLAGAFFAASLITAAFILGANFLAGSGQFLILRAVFVDSPLLFFAFVMLTEPMTTPPTRSLRIFYGALAGFLFVYPLRVGSIYFTPELALLAANIFAYAVSPKKKLILRLKEKIKIAPDIYDFLFESDKKFKFKPGQYMEWTLGHGGQDNRGMRRYFTIASSPAEPDIRMGVKFYSNSSSFKKSMLEMEPGDKIVASQLAGDFVLPKNKKEKLVFIAGGIGVTPYRSMIQHLLDIKEKRDIILIYCNKTPADVVYKDVFDAAEKELGIKNICAVDTPPAGAWSGEVGMLDESMIKRLVSDYLERTFYLSGPHAMVVGCGNVLRKMGVKRRRIKKDFFPGIV